MGRKYIFCGLQIRIFSGKGILVIHSNYCNNRILFFMIKIGYNEQCSTKMTDLCHSFLAKSLWICGIPDCPDVSTVNSSA